MGIHVMHVQDVVNGAIETHLYQNVALKSSTETIGENENCNNETM